MKAVYLAALLSRLATATPSSPTDRGGSSLIWKLTKFKSLVTFGDSYTDENRLNYFSSHNGSAPPVGWVDPIVSLLCLPFIHLCSRKQEKPNIMKE